MLLTKILVKATVSARHKIVKLQLWCSWRRNRFAQNLNKISKISWFLGTKMSLLFTLQASICINSHETRRILLFHILYIFPLLYMICQVWFCNSSLNDINNCFFLDNPWMRPEVGRSQSKNTKHDQNCNLYFIFRNVCCWSRLALPLV